MKIDNFEQIYPHLKFEREGDFYSCILLQRKKDMDVPANHQSSRTIKTYYIESVEQLMSKREEITLFCETFKCRAGISTNRFNHNDLAFDLLITIAERIKSGQTQLQYIYDSVVGEAKSCEKRWIIDLDQKEDVELIKDYVKRQQPNKEVIDVFPTYSGYHLLVNPFNSQHFKAWCEGSHIDAEIHKTNYIALYYPEKNI